MTIQELKSNVKWWESKRWIFNLLVGVSGLLVIINVLAESHYQWKLEDTLGVIIWGIGVNIFYSLGILLELFDWYYLNNRVGFKKLRSFFYIIGTFISCFYTFWFVLANFIGTPF